MVKVHESAADIDSPDGGKGRCALVEVGIVPVLLVLFLA